MQENQVALKQKLQQGLVQLELFTEARFQALWQYLLLLQKWNQVYNLTAIETLDAMISQHLLDSLVLAEHVRGQGHEFLDVGTGAGLPGIPLSIIFPEQHWTLLDSNGKKTGFLLAVKARLGLPNVEVVRQRVEVYQPDKLYHGILSRAFTTLEEFICNTRHLLQPSGAWYALKGPQVSLELASISAYAPKVIALQVPGLSAQRFLVKINNKN